MIEAGEGASAPGAEMQAPVEKPRVQASDLPDDALAKRLERAKEQARNDAIKGIAERFGMSLDDAEAKLKAAQVAEEAQKSELQRLQERLEKEAPKAAKADALSKRVKAMSELEYGELPEELKAVVDDLANDDQGQPDHEKRLDVIQSLRKRGLVAKKPVMPSGADTSRATPPPVTPDQPQPDTPEFHLQKWKSMPSLLAASYFEKHADKITKAQGYR